MIFHYNKIKTDLKNPHLYTSNVSMKKDIIQYFDENFPRASFEDVELGYRLFKDKPISVYNPKAIVIHKHPLTKEQLYERMTKAGKSANIIVEKHPELRMKYMPFTYPFAKTIVKIRLLFKNKYFAEMSRAYMGGRKGR